MDEWEYMNNFNDEGEDEEAEEGAQLAEAYDKLRSIGVVPYFDLEQYETLIAYYSLQSLPLKAVRVAEDGLVLFPESLELLMHKTLLISQHGAVKERDQIQFLIERMLDIGAYDRDSIVKLAWVLVEVGELDKALLLLEDAVNNYKPHSSLYDILGEAYFRKKEVELGIHYMREACMHSESPNYYLLKLATYGEYAQKPEIEIEALNKFLEINPEAYESWIWLGRAYSKSGDFEHAEHALQIATALDKTQPQAWTNLGEVYHEAKKYDLAIEAFVKSIALDELDGNPRLGLAQVLSDCDALEDALGHFKWVEDRHEELRKEARQGLGLVLVKLNRGEEALEKLNLALREDMHDTQTLAYLGCAYGQIGDREKAQIYFGQAYEKDIDNISHLKNYLQALYLNSKGVEGLTLLESHPELNTLVEKDAELKALYACLLFNSGNKVESLQYLEEAAEGDIMAIMGLAPIFEDVFNHSDVVSVLSKYLP